MEMLEPVAPVACAEASSVAEVEDAALCAGGLGEAAADCSCPGSFPCPRQALAIQRLSLSCELV